MPIPLKNPTTITAAPIVVTGFDHSAQIRNGKLHPEVTFHTAHGPLPQGAVPRKVNLACQQFKRGETPPTKAPVDQPALDMMNTIVNPATGETYGQVHERLMKAYVAASYGVQT